MCHLNNLILTQLSLIFRGTYISMIKIKYYLDRTLNIAIQIRNTKPVKHSIPVRWNNFTIRFRVNKTLVKHTMPSIRNGTKHHDSYRSTNTSET